MYLKFLWSLLRHKWFVFVECCKLGIPLLGIIHDSSKFSRDEFGAYANRFYGPRKGENTPEWKRGWLHHQNSNKHHPEYWIIRGRLGRDILPISDRYRREMLADWRGAGRAYGNPDTWEWYQGVREDIVLHPQTRAWVEEMLGVSI